MYRAKMISVDLFSVPASTGALAKLPEPDSVCLFIVQHIGEESFINEIACQLLNAGCRSFDFFGRQEPVWHMGFDQADIDLNPDSTCETVALTCGWSELDDLAYVLDEELSGEYSSPRECWLFYDDRALYDELLSRLGTPEQGQQP